MSFWGPVLLMELISLESQRGTAAGFFVNSTKHLNKDWDFETGDLNLCIPMAIATIKTFNLLLLKIQKKKEKMVKSLETFDTG